MTTVSADGLTTTTQIDVAGSGVFNETVTDQTVVDGSGNRTRTITAAASDGTVYGETVIVHNADGKTGSTNDYANYGTGLVLASNETKTLDGSGALVDTVTDYARNGSETGQTVTTTSANGLVATRQIDPSGAGVFEFTIASATVENADGSSTVTKAETAADGALITETVMNTSANGLSITMQTDHTGSGTFDTTVTDNTVDNSDGSITETISTTSANGTLKGKEIINTSADRSTVTVSTVNGDGETVQVDTRVTAPTGVTTSTLADDAPNGSLVNETVTATSANGLSITARTDANGDDVFDATTTDNTLLAANGSRTETITTTSANGTQTAQTVITTSANGLSKTATANIDGKVDYTTTDNTVLNTDGSTTETVTRTSENGTVIGSTITTTSGNGLSVTAETKNSVLDVVMTDNTVINADGSKTETVTDVHQGDGSLIDQMVTTTSASGASISIQSDTTGLGYNDQTETIGVDASGNTVATVSNYAANGALLNQTVTTTSANGLTKTVQIDLNGDGVFDRTQTSSTVYKADGSTTVTTVTMSGASVTASTVVATAANGLSSTMSAYDASGTLLNTRTDSKVVNADGSATETVSDTSGNGTPIDKTITTVSSDGKTTTVDNYIYGSLPRRSHEAIVLQADGSTISTLTKYDSSGSQVAQTVTTLSANGLVETSHGPNCTQSDTTTLNADGSKTETFTEQASPQNLLAGVGTGSAITSIAATYPESATVVDTTSANGMLQSIVTTGMNGEGSLNHSAKIATVINSDGSTTTTDTETVGASTDVGLKTISRDGMMQETKVSTFGNGTYDRDGVITTNPDGSTQVTITNLNPDGTVGEAEAIYASANGRSQTLTDNTTEDKLVNYENQSLSVSSNGNTTVVATNTNLEGGVSASLDGFYYSNRKVTVASSNGLSKTVAFDTNGDGSVDETLTDSVVLDADGSRTETITESDYNGDIITKKVITTSADGLTTTTNFLTSDSLAIAASSPSNTGIILRLNGDQVYYLSPIPPSAGGEASDDETTVKTLNSDGSTTTVTTKIASTGAFVGTSGSSTVAVGGTLYKSVINTSADGLTTTATYYLDGTDTPSVTEVDTTAPDGVKTAAETYYSNDGSFVAETITTTSADGLLIVVAHNNAPSGGSAYSFGSLPSSTPSTTPDTLETTQISSDGSGSYSWTKQSRQNGSDVTIVQSNHLIDSNGIDHIDLWINDPDAVYNVNAESVGTGQPGAMSTSSGLSVHYTISQTQESQYLSQIQNIYQVVYARIMTSEEQQTWLSYYTSSGLDIESLTNDLLNSKEFVGRFGSLSSNAFINLVYQNAFGRDPNSSELDSFLQQLNSNPGSRAELVDDIARLVDYVPSSFHPKNFSLTTFRVRELPDDGNDAPPDSEDDLNRANQTPSPLVLDLTGAGIKLTALSLNSPYFDLTADGFAHQTAWIGAGSGLLVLDKNGNGTINSGLELFGTAGGAADGFAALAAYDSNHDGKIDASDPVFSQLRVWVNPEEDGVTHPGELLTLAQLGISSINLSASSSSQTIAGNSVKLVSSYTLTNGTTREIGDVYFQQSPTLTKSDTQVTLTPDVLSLPEVPGCGSLIDLRSAAVGDATLKSQIQTLVANINQDPKATLSSIKTIMLEWSHSSAINPSSSGPYSDAQKIDFLEKYTGTAYDLPTGPGPYASIAVEEAWTSAFDGTTARLLLQAGYSLPEFEYDQSTDTVLPASDLHTSLGDLFKRLGDISSANAEQWEVALRVADLANGCKIDATKLPLNACCIGVG